MFHDVSVMWMFFFFVFFVLGVRNICNIFPVQIYNRAANITVCTQVYEEYYKINATDTRTPVQTQQQNTQEIHTQHKHTTYHTTHIKHYITQQHHITSHHAHH